MTKEQQFKALDTTVIAVASATIEVGDWSAYIKGVPGKCHEKEWEEVYKHGAKLPFNVAKEIFPDFARKYEWRC